ncbi:MULTISPECIES: carboxy terminal-processing peptidase [unclassified Serratia (in: enterobacteria)]|uniref:carboxy terminal-processing peptidase n=1 Tax=unclassified Serratia (in: enterobacteria) TaxID=2647522 RepID=UPI002ED301FA|nr:carboxy terminal-processing peptidase [Serratia sp. C2(2)]MEE4447421.1 carboxy terminal-processing peptidase [Serratia sp. C2(1)]
MEWFDLIFYRCNVNVPLDYFKGTAMDRYNGLKVIFLLFSVSINFAAAEMGNGIQSSSALSQEPQQIVAGKRITEKLMQSHYKHFVLDDSFSKNIFNAYINMLDENRDTFTGEDIALFSQRQFNVAGELSSGRLDTAYLIFNHWLQRRETQYQYALNLLEKPLNFDNSDRIDIDRSQSPWPSNLSEINQLWFLKVKSDELNLKLLGKSWPEMQSILTNRYQFAIKRLKQESSEDVFELFMNAFCREIDPHTTYLSSNHADSFNDDISLSLEGIGIGLKLVKDSDVVVGSIIPGGPAAKTHKLHVGDRIIGVGDGNDSISDITGLNLNDVTSLIKGTVGSKVRLKVLPKSGVGAYTITLVRARLRQEDQAAKFSVRMVDGKRVGLLTIPGFYTGLAANVQTLLTKIKQQEIDSIMIDLRNNGGGPLSEAVALSGLFVPNGAVVQLRDSNGKIWQESSTNAQVYQNFPMVILVNRLSASASEIFAAAMQDYDRGIIVGETTYGKGTVQQYHELGRIFDKKLHPEWPRLGAITYTIQKFYRINGSSTQRKGVTPDLAFPFMMGDDDIGERFGKNALGWDSITPAIYRKSGHSKSYVSQLSALYKSREKQDFNVNSIMKKMNETSQTYDKGTLSLNYALREKFTHDENSRALKAINENLSQLGKKTVSSLDEINSQDNDIDLKEATRIAADLAKLAGNNNDSLRS